MDDLYPGCKTLSPFLYKHTLWLKLRSSGELEWYSTVTAVTACRQCIPSSCLPSCHFFPPPLLCYMGVNNSNPLILPWFLARDSASSLLAGVWCLGTLIITMGWGEPGFTNVVCQLGIWDVSCALNWHGSKTCCSCFYLFGATLKHPKQSWTGSVVEKLSLNKCAKFWCSSNSSKVNKLSRTAETTKTKNK